MNPRVQFTLLSATLLFAASASIAQPASSTWPLSSSSTITSSVSGSVVGQDETFGGMVINSYSGPSSSQRVTTTTGSWPAETNQDDSRYIQFSVSPAVGYDFNVSSISLSLGASGGSNMKAKIWYSTDPTFASRTRLDSLALPSSSLSSLSYTPSVAVHDGQTLYLRIHPWYTSASTGKYVCPQNVVIAGTAVGATGTITVSASELSSFGAVLSGSTSASQSYMVSGQNLLNNIVISAPSGFEISLDGTNYSGLLSLSPSGGTVPSTLIYAHFVPTSANGTNSGTISHTSSASTTSYVAVSGVAIASEPTSSSSVAFGTTTGNSIVVNFSGGNGTNRILVARASAPVIWSPVDGNPVAGVSSNFSAATDQGSGNKVVYDGTGTSVSVTGLTQSTLYHFAVYEYNVGTNNSQNFLTSSSGTGSISTLAVPTILVTPSTLAFGNVDVNTYSAEKTFSISGANLSPASGNISVNSPGGFDISTTSGGGFGSSIVVPYAGGSLPSTAIYVRFHPTAITQYAGNITSSGGSAATENVAVTGNGRGPSEPNVLQAEDGLLSGAYVRSQHYGYTGSGYVDIADKQYAALELDFRRVSASTDTVKVFFANGGSSRAYAVSLNGSAVGSLSFVSTGSWSTWSSVVMMVPMQAGINRLRFTSTTNGGNANIDKISIGGQTATPVYKLLLAKSGSGVVAAVPAYADSFYDAGSSVQLSATPTAGSVFAHWTGTDQSTSNPYTITMNSHHTEIATMPASPGYGPFPYEATPRGFAAVGAFGYANGTTGGGGSESQTVFVTNAADLNEWMLRRVDVDHSLNFPPLTIYVIGTLTSGSGVTDMLDVKDTYDVSIVGVGTDATMNGFGLKIVRAKNIIVRNIKFLNSSDDGINIQADDASNTGGHIWIDHCTFSSHYDGALDVTHGAEYVTLSWNHFYSHDKTCLMGHSDSQTSDTQLKVTYHHNYFDSTVQRHPRVRYGKAHVYNNYYRKNPLYGVSSNDGAHVMMEGNYFLNVPLPSDTSRDGSIPGNLVSRYNIFETCGAYQARGTVFNPSDYYSYSVDSASTIPWLVSTYSGSGLWDFSYNTPPEPLPVQLSSFTGHSFGGGVQLLWSTISEVNNYGFYAERKRAGEISWTEVANSFVAGHGTTNEPHSYSCVDQYVGGGVWQYRLRQVDLNGSIHYSDPIQVDVVTAVNESVPAKFALYQNYPNPFNPSTQIEFSVDKSGVTTLDVFDILGRKVFTLLNEVAQSGRKYSVKFDGGDLASGIYFYQLKSGSRSEMKKLMLLK